MCFVYFKKAFDSISHDKLRVTMMDMGYPLHTIDLLAKLYKKQLAKVKVAGTLSEWFRVKKGVRQCCVLSPYFSTFRWRSQKFSTGGASICSIPFCPFPFSCPTDCPWRFSQSAHHHHHHHHHHPENGCRPQWPLYPRHKCIIRLYQYIIIITKLYCGSRCLGDLFCNRTVGPTS